MSRYFAPITIDELKQKILSAYNKQANSRDEDTVTIKAFDDDGEYLDGFIFSEITSKIQQDLRKIEFDWENFLCKPFSPESSHLGFYTLDNGLTYFMCYAGGDWELPVSFIIYWDGSCLRAYIPTDGNVFNRTTRQAFGNDDDADEAEALKNYNNKDWQDIESDPVAMIEDIKTRIIRK